MSTYPDLYEASVAELQAGLNAGHFTSVDLVKAYFARIKEVNLEGPSLRAVYEMNPNALTTAADLDAERKEKGTRSALHGIPVLVKDNIATLASEGMNTTAGSLSLQGSVVPDDASIVKRLRAAGAIILGKTSLSEWAHFRGDCASGWSGIGGQTTGAYYPKTNPSGSSSGSGVAASIGLAVVTIGTETDGSIISPSNRNNIVGIKPTVGLTSRTGVVPISPCQDTVGPMTRCVADAAVVLSIIAGKDTEDTDTLSQPDTVPDFSIALDENALKGKRIGVPRRVFLDDKHGRRSDILAAFEEALSVIRSLGATIVDPADMPSVDEIYAKKDQVPVLDVDFKVGLNDYLAKLVSNPSGVRTLTDVIAFNNKHPELEKPKGFEDQAILIRADATTGRDDTFKAALASNRNLGGARGIDAALKEHNLDALVLPSDGLTTTPSAMAGYPIVSVPLGFFSETVVPKPEGPRAFYPAPGVPFGLSFLGTAYSDFDLVGFAYAYEQRTKTRLARRAYAAAVPRTQLADVVNVVCS